jgi:hypothetical protein
MRYGWKKNTELFKDLMSRERFDIIVADEAYELVEAIRKRKININARFVIIYDFVGLDVFGWNPLVRMITHLKNSSWALDSKKVPDEKLSFLFVGELDDVPDKRFGWLLPNRKKHVIERNYHFLGHIVRFDPSKFKDKEKIRKKLGIGSEPLIVTTVGGTIFGKPLLGLSNRAYPFIKEQLPDAKMILNTSMRIKPEEVEVHEGIEVIGYTEKLYEYFAAADIVITQGGATTTNELVALNKPFIYFPLENQFDQQFTVAGRLERYGFGIKLRYPQTTPRSLARTVIENINKEVKYEGYPTGGEKKAASIIKEMLLADTQK